MDLLEIKSNYKFNDKFDKIKRRLSKNPLISWYYQMMSEDMQFDDLPDVVINAPCFKEDFWHRRSEDMKERGKRVALCGHYIQGKYYPLQGIKDVEKIYLCHDRFCDNCQNGMAVQRSEKYEPALMKLTEDYDIYHVVLTVPNVGLFSLSLTIDRIFRAYKRLCIFLSGRKNVRGVNYSGFGYLGSIRALEVTKNKEMNTFHPHLHCIFICRKGSKLALKRTHQNTYSFKSTNSHISRGIDIRLFNDYEILLQKTWRLLYEGIELNYSNLDELKVGYSCMIDNAKGRYKEVFKYATKGLLSSDPDKDPMDSYSDFVLLFISLFRRRLIQGYGCLYNLKFDEKIDLSPDDIYLQIIEELNKLEKPMEFNSYFYEVEDEIVNGKNITYISRRSVARLGADDE